MEHLTDVIIGELTRAGYKKLTDELWVNEVHTDFWLVHCKKFDYELPKVQGKLCSAYVNLFSDFKLMEKNTSLLILNEVENVDSKNPEKVVAEENDPYDFKKYIIQYTRDEWNQAKAFLSEETPLASVLMNPTIFNKLKADGACSPVALLYTIAHKLPFIMMPVEHKEFQFRNELYYKSQDESELDSWLNSITSQDSVFEKIDEYLNSIRNV